MGEDVPVLVTSSATRQGLDELARELLRRVPPAEPEREEAAGEDEVAEFQVFRPGGAAAPSRSSASTTAGSA